MEGIEYNNHLIQEEYWLLKLENANLENDFWQLKIQKLKDGED